MFRRLCRLVRNRFQGLLPHNQLAGLPADDILVHLKQLPKQRHSFDNKAQKLTKADVGTVCYIFCQSRLHM